VRSSTAFCIATSACAWRSCSVGEQIVLGCHTFTGSASGACRDGAYPIGGVTFDASGAL
jgi:hypothetical protein